MLKRLGFDERIRGDHHIFSQADVEEILNLQPKGGKAKAYQVKQVRKTIVSNGLAACADSDEAATDSDSAEASIEPRDSDSDDKPDS